MLRQFVDLVNEAVDEGYTRGIDLFMESLEADLAKDEVLSEHGVDSVVAFLFEDAGVEVDAAEMSDDLDSIDEKNLDAALAELEKDTDLEDE